MGKTYMPTRTAAEMLGISPRTLEKWRVTGQGPAFFKFGGKVFYTEDGLQNWAASRIRRSTSDDGSISSSAISAPEASK